MITHDCSKCKASGDCPLESIAPWLNEHSEDIDRVLRDQNEMLSTICAQFATEFPPVVMKAEDFKHSITSAFVIGYCKGRTFPIVPEVYEREVT